MSKRFLFFVSVPVLMLSTMCYVLCTASYADTIRMKTGKEVKGIIVEDYVNRVVISTPDGEQTVMKSKIAALRYDSEEDNLIKLARRARERRDYKTAYANYERALKINPDSKAAQDGLTSTRAALLRKDEARKADDIQRRQAFEASGSPLGTIEPGRRDIDDMRKRLDEQLGITLKMEDAFPRIMAVRPDGPAAVAGARAGDLLVAVWSRLTGYMSLKEVMGILLAKQSLEVKVTIERKLDVAVNQKRHIFSGLNDLIGATFVMKFDGMTVSQVKELGAAATAGLMADDLVTAVDGRSTRYMPLKRAVDVIRKSKGDVAKIAVRRELIIWRQGR